MIKIKTGKYKNYCYFVFKRGRKYCGYWIDNTGEKHYEKQISFHNPDNMISYLIFSINSYHNR